MDAKNQASGGEWCSYEIQYPQALFSGIMKRHMVEGSFLTVIDLSWEMALRLDFG